MDALPGIVVQKYGGSSVADVEKIQRVAGRVAETRARGLRVVVVVSGSLTNHAAVRRRSRSFIGSGGAYSRGGRSCGRGSLDYHRRGGARGGGVGLGAGGGGLRIGGTLIGVGGLGLGVGVSAAQRVPYTEVSSQAGKTTSRLLQYLDPTLDISVGDLLGVRSLKCGRLTASRPPPPSCRHRP